MPFFSFVRVIIKVVDITDHHVYDLENPQKTDNQNYPRN